MNSAVQFEEILQSYIDAVNREPEEVDIIVFYFSGYDSDGYNEYFDPDDKMIMVCNFSYSDDKIIR